VAAGLETGEKMVGEGIRLEGAFFAYFAFFATIMTVSLHTITPLLL
jgi:hypothetical protein